MTTALVNDKCAEVKKLLEKIAGEESATKALESANDKILDQDVEVVDLCLAQQECFFMRAAQNIFPMLGFLHAWLAMGSNMQHSTETEDLLPIYTEAGDKFWLFFDKS